MKTGYAFAGWNTVAGGTGTAYAERGEFSLRADDDGGRPVDGRPFVHGHLQRQWFHERHDGE